MPKKLIPNPCLCDNSTAKSRQKAGDSNHMKRTIAAVKGEKLLCEVWFGMVRLVFSGRLIDRYQT